MNIFNSFMRSKATTKASLLGGVAGLIGLSIAMAAVMVTSGPSVLFASAQTLPANSHPLGLFELNLSQDAGESLSSVTVHVNNVAPAATVASDIANVAVYKDNGDGNFDPASDMLAGSQSSVAIDGNTTITTASNNSIGTSTSKFFISLSTGGTWSSTTTPDMVTVTFPTDGLVVGTSTPTTTVPVTAATTPIIQADSVGPVLTSAVAMDTAGTPTKTAGDTLVFNFNEATNKPAITTANVDATLGVNNGHSLKNGGGVLGAAVWDGSGTSLTLTLNDNGFGVPTVAVGDMVAAMGSVITDAVGNPATGSTTITGTFGSQFDASVATEVRNASNSNNTNTSVTVGTAVHDYAVVSGIGSTTTATGTATFSLYGTSDCMGSALATQDLSLSGGAASSDATTTLAIGSYGYRAAYSGNEMYAASMGTCEPFTVIAATTGLTPTIATDVQNASNISVTGTTVVTGTVVHDYALVSGSNGIPTGTIDFMRYTNSTCSGDPAATESNTALSGSGGAASSGFTTVAGMMSYRVHYDGNGTYNAADAGCETLTVQDVVPPPTGGTQCPNGLINGRLYMVQGQAKVYLAADCRLKAFKGNALGHAKGKKFQNIIPLPASSVDANGNIINTFSVIQLGQKPDSKKEGNEKDSQEGNGSHGNGHGKGNGKGNNDDQGEDD